MHKVVTNETQKSLKNQRKFFEETFGEKETRTLLQAAHFYTQRQSDLYTSFDFRDANGMKEFRNRAVLRKGCTMRPV